VLRRELVWALASFFVPLVLGLVVGTFLPPWIGPTAVARLCEKVDGTWVAEQPVCVSARNRAG
jgi:hypothetical protein